MRRLMTKLKSLNYSLLDQAIVSGSNFLSALFVVRLIGIYDFGIFSTYWIFLLFVNTAFVSLIVSPMMLLIPKESDVKTYYGSLWSFVLTFSFFFFFLSWIFSSLYEKFYLGSHVSFFGVLFGIYLVTHHLQEFYRRYFYSKRFYGDALVIDTLSYAVRVLILLALLIFQIKVEGLKWIFLVYIGANLIGIAYGMFKFRFSLDMAAIKGHIVEHLDIAKWLLPSGFLKWTSVNLFTASSSFILGPTALGVIKLSQNIVAVYNLVLLGMENFLPLDSSTIFHKKGIKGLVKFLTKVTFIGLAFTAIVGLVLSGLAENIIGIVYGDEFVKHSYILYWFSIFILFMFMNSILNIYLITVKQTKITFKAYLITSIFSLSAFYPLIRTYKITGVLIGVLCSYALLIGLTFLLIKKKNGTKVSN